MVRRVMLVALTISLLGGTVNRSNAQVGAQLPAPGAIVGIVVGPDDARLPGVAVTITSPATRWTVTVVTDDRGQYRRSNLPPDEYEVAAALDGFDRRSSRVSLMGGELLEVNFKLLLSTVSETVEVVGTVVKEDVATSEIRESTARDVGEALSELNGVYQVRKGAIANDVIVGGFQSRNLTVLIDGQRIYGACPNGMDPAVFHADFAEVDHLEVAKGPFDVRHEGSLGGVVNVITRTPGKGFHTDANLAFGSNGYINPSITASIGTASLSVLGGLSYRTSNAYRDGSGRRFTEYANYLPGKSEGAAFVATTGWARTFVAPRAGHSFQLAYTRQRATDIKYPYLQMDGLNDIADRASASHEIVLGEGFVRALSAKAYYTRVNHWMTDQFRTSSVGMAREYSMASQADTRTTGGSLEIVAGSLAAGVEIYRRNWNISTLLAGMKYAPQYSVPDVTIDHLGAFVEYQRTFGDHTKVEAGGRVDRATSAADSVKANTDLYFAYKGTRSTSASDATASGKIQVVRQFGQRVELIAGVGHTARVPDPQERYFALKRSGSDWVGNPSLTPTGNTGVTGGVNLNLRRLVVSGRYSYDYVSDFITVHDQARVNVVPGIVNAQSRSYENVNARMRSGELMVTYQVTDSLFAAVNASYTRGTKATDPAKAITSSNVAEIHPMMGGVSLRYDRSVLFGEIETRFSGKHVYVDTDLQEEPMPAYGVVNVKVGARRSNARLTVALDNVLNQLYVDHMSYQRDPFRLGTRVREPGRNLYVNLAYRF